MLQFIVVYYTVLPERIVQFLGQILRRDGQNLEVILESKFKAIIIKKDYNSR